MTTLNKEQVYDTKISPLVGQIVQLCMDNGIGMLLDFHLPTKENPDLACTTCIPDETGKRIPNHIRYLRGYIKKLHEDSIEVPMANGHIAMTSFPEHMPK